MGDATVIPWDQNIVQLIPTMHSYAEHLLVPVALLIYGLFIPDCMHKGHGKRFFIVIALVSSNPSKKLFTT